MRHLSSSNFVRDTYARQSEQHVCQREKYASDAPEGQERIDPESTGVLVLCIVDRCRWTYVHLPEL